jgi:hypothetical protein
MSRRVTRVASHVLVQGEGGLGARVTRLSVHVLELEAPRESIVDAQPTDGASRTPLAPIAVEVRRGGVKDTTFNGLVNAVRRSGNPVLTGVLEVQAIAGAALFDGIVPVGKGTLLIDFIPRGGDVVTSDPIEVIGGAGGATTMTRSTGGAMSTFRR